MELLRTAKELINRGRCFASSVFELEATVAPVLSMKVRGSFNVVEDEKNKENIVDSRIQDLEEGKGLPLVRYDLV